MPALGCKCDYFLAFFKLSVRAFVAETTVIKFGCSFFVKRKNMPRKKKWNINFVLERNIWVIFTIRDKRRSYVFQWECDPEGFRVVIFRWQDLFPKFPTTWNICSSDAFIWETDSYKSYWITSEPQSFSTIQTGIY